MTLQGPTFVYIRPIGNVNMPERYVSDINTRTILDVDCNSKEMLTEGNQISHSKYSSKSTSLDSHADKAVNNCVRLLKPCSGEVKFGNQYA